MESLEARVECRRRAAGAAEKTDACRVDPRVLREQLERTIRVDDPRQLTELTLIGDGADDPAPAEAVHEQRRHPEVVQVSTPIVPRSATGPMQQIQPARAAAIGKSQLHHGGGPTSRGQ